MTMSAAEFLEQWFETEPLKATMSASGIIGTFQGPRSPGTAYVLLHHYMGEIDGAFRAWGIPRGGTGGISYAIADAALGLGVEIRTETPVTNVIVKGGRAVGVALESGEEIEAGVVMSSVDANLTFLKLLESGTLDPDFEAEVRRYKFRGSSGKVNLALDGLPELACKPGVGPWLRGAISFSPSLDYMERAYDDAKYGRFSRRPYIDCIIPTLVDPSMAPPGKHVMSLLRAVRARTSSSRARSGTIGCATTSRRRSSTRSRSGSPTSAPRSSTGSCCRRRTSRTGPGSPRATSSRASSRWSSSSSTGRWRAGPATGPP